MALEWEQLGQMQAEHADQDLRLAMDRIDGLFSDLIAHEAEEGMDPEIAALLDELSGAESARADFRSLHQRVHEDRLTWAAFWASPQEEPGGLALFSAVVHAQLARQRQNAAEQPPQS
ncbi:MAG: hypothetical protein H0X12_08490 [Nocardioides sp.]|nr:hypothetical protein [Nocardioides sp.]